MKEKDMDLKQKILEDAKKRAAQILHDAKSAAYKNVQPAKREAEELKRRAKSDAASIRQKIVSKNVPVFKQMKIIELENFVQAKVKELIEKALFELWEQEFSLIVQYGLKQVIEEKENFVCYVSAEKLKDVKSNIDLEVKPTEQKGKLYFVSIDEKTVIDLSLSTLVDEFKAKLTPLLLEKIKHEAEQ